MSLCITLEQCRPRRHRNVAQDDTVVSPRTTPTEITTEKATEISNRKENHPESGLDSVLKGMFAVPGSGTGGKTADIQCASIRSRTNKELGESECPVVSACFDQICNRDVFISHAKSATFAKFLGGGDMDIEEIEKDILDCSYAIHTRFGSGLLEKAYRVILATELRRLGHKVEEEKVCGFSYNG